MTYSYRNFLANPLETKAEGDDTDPIKALEALGGVINGKLEGFAGELKKIGDRVDTEIAKRNRPGTETKDEGDQVERKAFTAFIRKGAGSLGPDELKSLRVSDDAAGGFLAPPEFSAEVDKNLVQFSPVRTAARVGPTSAGSVIIPRRTGRPTGQWVGENETRPETASAYGQVDIPVDEMACYVDVSNKLLEDSAINIDAEVAFDVAEEFGRLEGAAFVSGNGVKKPL
ncbi:MAG TPA: phage major capsid protein, partial [Reyranella sp.]|nr:phage major capsid protein [Reyranella sp.]